MKIHCQCILEREESLQNRLMHSRKQDVNIIVAHFIQNWRQVFFLPYLRCYIVALAREKEKRKSYWFLFGFLVGSLHSVFLCHKRSNIIMIRFQEHCEDTKPVLVPTFPSSNMLRSSSEFLFIILYHTQFYDIFMGFLAWHGMAWRTLIYYDTFNWTLFFWRAFRYSFPFFLFVSGFFFFHSVLNAQAHTSSFNGIDLFLFPLLLAIVMLYWCSFFPFDI